MNYIINQRDNKKYSIFSNIGKNLLKNYINTFMKKQIGGMFGVLYNTKKKKKKKEKKIIVN